MPRTAAMFLMIFRCRVILNLTQLMVIGHIAVAIRHIQLYSEGKEGPGEIQTQITESTDQGHMRTYG